MPRVTPNQHQPQPGASWAFDVGQVESGKLADWDYLYALCPLIDGVLLTGVGLPGGSTTTIAHGLGRPYRGFIRVRSDTNTDYPADVVRDEMATYLKLDVTGDQTVDLWVF